MSSCKRVFWTTAWKNARLALLNAGTTPTIRFQTATERSKSELPFLLEVEVVELAKEERPFGLGLGTLVHTCLATVPLDGGEDDVAAIAELRGRIFWRAKQ
jgi:hypothetical protein